MKTYNVKVYALDGTTLVRVITPGIIMGGFSWSEQINGGQGQLKLKIKLPFSSSNLAYNQIVRVYSSDSTYSAAPRVVFAGIVSILNRVSDIDGEYIEMTAIGLCSMMNWLYYTSGGAYAFNKNQAQDVTMKDIVDVFTVKYPGLISYTGTSVEASVGTGNIAFSYTKMLDALKNTAVTTAYWWSIDRNGLLQFHPKTGGATPTTHYLTMGKNVEKLEVEENSEKIVNKYMVKYTGGGPYIAQDATSQTNNGLRELYEDKTSTLNDLTVATSTGDAYVADNKDVTKRIIVTVNNKYDIDSIQAGHFVTIRNLDYTISFLQIVRLEYNMDSVRLELEKALSLADEILS